MQDDKTKEALREILENCRQDDHSFRTINNHGEGMDSHTTKWCRKCGCIRVANCDAIVSSQVPEIFDLIASSVL